MALKIYNTITRTEEIFEPLSGTDVKLYTCGPTVYDYPHIGNYRTFIFGDMLKRYLNYRGYTVDHIMNITDIDDKTIKNSIDQGKTLQEFTEFYTEEFYKDRDSLNIIPANKYPKATNYIDAMVKMIESLINSGHAYKGDDGSVYFKISSFASYGKLSHLDLSTLKENAKGRMNNDEYDKDNTQDFALWKAYSESDGEVFWNPSTMLGVNTTLGKGRPGWHIECSAMATSELGNSIDIHTGGVDNIFPHHENEIAQSECVTNQDFSKYWMHSEWLLVEGKKMAKSAGNFYTLRDLMDKGITPLGYRMWLYTAHYRTQVNLSIDTVKGADTALARLREAFIALGDDASGQINEDYKSKFVIFMDEDLNSPKAVALMYDLLKDTSIPNKDKRATLLDFDKVFGFEINQTMTKEDIPDEVIRLAEERNAMRKLGDYEQSDRLRAKIEAHGYNVKDITDGYKLNKI